jgi:threonine synthase
MSIFIDASEIPTADLAELTNKSYTSQSGWESNAVTPLIELGELSVLEQFHGPTCAFKDVALQFLGNLFEYFLAKRNEGKKEGEQQASPAATVLCPPAPATNASPLPDLAVCRCS